MLFLLVLALLMFGSTDLRAQTPDDAAPDSSESSIGDRFWLSGQANFITQYHPEFSAKYSGPNSLQPSSESATSRVLTLYTGVAITKSTEFLFDLEEAGGGGLSNALGVAGFPNLDVVRNPTLSQAPYVARIMLRQIIPLGKETTEVARGPLGLAGILPVKRLEIRAGKFSTADFFDLNSVGSDSHLQFMNWTVDNNGAYDYAADTRGYTYGLLMELYDRAWVLRFGELLMPTVANGIKLDWDLERARSENVEYEIHHDWLPKRETIIRTLGYVNHANMGSYREAIDEYLDGQTSTPDVTATRQQGRIKYGFGLNVEQQVSDSASLYGRLGWADGKYESFAYTEVDRSASFGGDITGRRWKRDKDKAGAAFVVNAICGDHARYLQLGGEGFLLGDGGLNYGFEKILESYYTLHAWRGASVAFDLQRIWNPGYNRDRGPVTVIGFRVHLEGAVHF